jgi:hypothetical protein
MERKWQYRVRDDIGVMGMANFEVCKGRQLFRSAPHWWLGVLTSAFGTRKSSLRLAHILRQRLPAAPNMTKLHQTSEMAPIK